MMRRASLILVLLTTALTLNAASAIKPDRILVLKSQRKLILLNGNTELKSYRIALGRNPVGPKELAGDNRTPEGKYVISGRNLHSQYHRSLRISYPNSQDRAHAKRLGRNAGGDIFIHGLPNGQGWIGRAHTMADWTLGCIAVTNEEIEEIWTLVPDGTPIEIRP